jgi:hypothetical protein
MHLVLGILCLNSVSLMFLTQKKKHVDQIADGVDAGVPVRPLGGGSDAAGFQMQRE